MRKQIAIHNKRSHIVAMSCPKKKVVIRLAPGWTQISKLAWDSVKDSPSIQARIDDDWLELGPEKNEEIDPASYLELNAARARKEAREMDFHADTIKSWLEVEHRRSVINELQKRLDQES